MIKSLFQQQICKSTIQQFGLGDRVTAECAELSTVPELVSAADVIVLNNVFDWFMPNDAKAKVTNLLYLHTVFFIRGNGKIQLVLPLKKSGFLTSLTLECLLNSVPVP